MARSVAPWSLAWSLQDSRCGPFAPADRWDWQKRSIGEAPDLVDPEAALDATKGAAVVYQCLSAPYTRWPEMFPPLQRNVIAAAEDAGALLVTLENVYG